MSTLVVDSPSVASVAIDPETVRVAWADGTTNAFHHVWLRDNCPCGACRHREVGERTVCTADIPLDITVQGAEPFADGAELRLTWPDGHVSCFSAAWLATYAYDRPRTATPTKAGTSAIEKVLWTTDLIRAQLPEVSYQGVMASDEALVEWLTLMHRYGFVIVRGVPTDDGQVAELARRVGNLRDSNFGLLWDVKSMPQPDSLAYTAVKLSAHTDLVSRESQPGMQFLHCLVNESEGGESVLVDGFAVAEELRRTAPQHWTTLTECVVPYRYLSVDTDVTASFPVIRLDDKGRYFEVRYSNALTAPLDLAPHQVLPFYAAYQAFSALLRDPRFELVFKLQPGDCEVFDNRRVLHGRQEFDPQTGARHLQGCYIDTDDWHSRLKVLQRTEDHRLR